MSDENNGFRVMNFRNTFFPVRIPVIVLKFYQRK